jgi:ferredoxin
MELTVDFDLCDRQGVCVFECPEVFEFDDDDFMQIVQPHPPEDLWPKVRRAARGCPKHAIHLEEGNAG